VRGIVLLLVLHGTWVQAADCAGTHPRPAYDAKLFDAMAQIDGGLQETVLREMDGAGVQRMALFARRHPKRDGEADVLALVNRYPDRFVIGVPKRFDLRGDLPDDYVDATLQDLAQRRYRFIGEILFVHADKEHGEQTLTGERYVAGNGPNVHRLMAVLRAQRVPLMTHWEVYDWERDWPLFDALYARYRDVVFIWPHGGFGSAEQVRQVLAAHPNVVVTLSKREKAQRSLSSEDKAGKLGPAVIDSCGQWRSDWRSLVRDYPDRFMFATDAHKPSRWSRYRDIVRQWRGILGQLPAEEARKLAWDNSSRIYGAEGP